jgi:hypothetical protein
VSPDTTLQDLDLDDSSIATRREVWQAWSPRELQWTKAPYQGTYPPHKTVSQIVKDAKARIEVVEEVEGGDEDCCCVMM